MDFSKTKYSQLQPTLLNAPPSRALYKLRSNTIQKDHTNRIAKCELGILNPNAPPPGKVLMLLGQTGSGKTTLISSLINHILGVKWEDPFRFTLITSADESATGAPVSQTQSQTQWVTIYVIHKMDCSVLPFTLTVNRYTWVWRLHRSGKGQGYHDTNQFTCPKPKFVWSTGVARNRVCGSGQRG